MSHLWVGMQGCSNKRELYIDYRQERGVLGVIENPQATLNSRSFLPRRRRGYTPHLSGSALCCCIMPIINHVTTRDAFDAFFKPSPLTISHKPYVVFFFFLSASIV